MIQKQLSIVSFSALVLFFISCNKNIDAGNTDPFDPSKSLELKNVTYASGVRNKADVYLPANRSAANTACVIMLHGGSWIAGDKADNNTFIPLIKQALQGVAIVNMNYTLADGNASNTHPAQVKDVAALLRFVDSISATWHIKKQYGLIGISAGAHLALLYSYSFDALKQIQLVASFVGPTNISDAYYTGNPLFEPILVSFTGKRFADDPNLYKAMSPALNVTATSAPTYMAYGGADPLVPVSNPTLLAANLQAKGVPFKYDFYASESHELSAGAITTSLTSLSAFWKLHVK